MDLAKGRAVGLTDTDQSHSSFTFRDGLIRRHTTEQRTETDQWPVIWIRPLYQETTGRPRLLSRRLVMQLRRSRDATAADGWHPDRIIGRRDYISALVLVTSHSAEHIETDMG